MNDLSWRPRLGQSFRSGENLLVTSALLVMVVLPLAEAALRRTGQGGISGSTLIVQHLTLLVGVLGGAIAARENRLLSLSTVTTYLRGRWKTSATVIANGIAAAVSLFLCIASVQFALSERESGNIVAYGVRTWWVQMLLPIGFGLVAVRLLRHAAAHWRGRLIAVLLCVAVVMGGAWWPGEVAACRWPAVAVLLVATLLGAPVFTTLGGLAVILFWTAEEPIAAISVTHYSLVVNPSLPAIPLFTLAGYFLAEGGASRRLVRVFQSMIGPIRGGPAIVTALVCAFFTSFTGASGVTILALGGLLMPVLLAARYTERQALGLLTGAGSLGLLFPPCLPLILYAIISTQAKAPITIEQMFLGGVLPGVLMLGLIAWWGVAVGPRRPADRPSFQWRVAARAAWDAKWELALPVVALLALFGGFATPVEAAAITALYALIVESIVYRDLKWWGGATVLASDPAAADRPDRPKPGIAIVVIECGLLVGGVLLILGVANGFTNYLVDAQVPSHLVDWVKSSIQSPWVFLLLLNVFLLVVGCLMDIYSAIVVVVPLIIPIGKAFGIDPIHLGIIFLANLELGYLTPPVGMNLFLSSYRFRKPMTEVTRAIIPILLVLLVGVLLITYVPPLTTWLPRLLSR